MEKSKKSLVLGGIIAAFCLGSCLTTTNELDLDKDISLDMQIGPGGLTIPLGSLDTLYLDSLIKVDGDESVLDTLYDGLYGFTMDGDIDKVTVSIGDVTINIPKPEIDEITASFDQTDVDDITIDEKSQNTTINISSIDLSSINNQLPTPISSFRTEPIQIPVVPGIKISNPLTSQDYIELAVPSQSVNIEFNYTLPEDVASVNRIIMGDENTDKGQTISLYVNLASIFAVSDNPEITLESFQITFPENFYLSKSDALSNYLTGGSIGVSGQVFSITNAKVLNDAVSGNYMLPITLVVDSADFKDYTVQEDDKLKISYKKEIAYSMSIRLAGTSTASGTKNVYVDVTMNDKLHMRDFSVDTRKKQLSLASGSVESSYSVTGLDNLSKVNYIEFDESQSILNLSISDFDINPFSFDDNSAIRLQFPLGFEFVKAVDGMVYVDNEAVGKWVDNSNMLDIWPGYAKGKTMQLAISRLDIYKTVDEDSKSIELNNDVSYGGNISIAAMTDLDRSALDALTDKNISLKVWGSFKVKNANVETARIETEFNESTGFFIDEEIDQALVQLNSISLAQPAGAYLQLKFKGIPESISKLTLSDVTMVFPDFILLRYIGNDHRIRVSNDTLFINGDLYKDEFLDEGEGFCLSGLQIEGMEFKDPLMIEDGHIKLTDSVRVSGAVVVGSQLVNSEDMKDVRVTPTIDFDPVIVKSVTGKVNPVIDDVHEEVDIDLGDDLDFMRDKDNRLMLSDPQITININSTVTVPINLNLALSSKDSNGLPIATDITPDNGVIRLEKCDIESESRNTTIIIYKNDMVVPQSDDTLYVRMSHLSDLMSSIPDKILFDLKAEIDQSGQHYVDLTRELSVSGSYKVSIPLSFDSLYIEYSDTVSDLSESLEDIADKIEATKLQLVADIESTIPLGVTLKAKALDKNDKVINDISIASCEIAPGTPAVTKSVMTLDVDVRKGALERLESIVFTAECESGEGNASIKKGQWLLVKKMRLLLPEGLKVDLTDKKDK